MDSGDCWRDSIREVLEEITNRCKSCSQVPKRIIIARTGHTEFFCESLDSNNKLAHWLLILSEFVALSVVAVQLSFFSEGLGGVGGGVKLKRGSKVFKCLHIFEKNLDPIL